MPAGSPTSRRLLLGAVALAVVAALGVGAVLLLRGGDPGGAGTAAVAERPGPVVLVPGYGGSTAALQPLADRLGAEGRDATVVALPGDGTGDLTRAADALAAAVDDALARTGADSVDVVGYSAGGLVARLWAADGGAHLARRVVTLGSPHHGTTVADLAATVAPDRCPEGCRQMTTRSALVAALNAGDETPAGPDWVSVWTTADRTVTPPESARLDGALNVPVQSVCADARTGHEELPSDPLVAGLVVEVLGPGELVAPVAADCGRLRAG
ncbi:lipase family alpha/beta hydrolase [Geodermatophilus sp. SYSU D00742]